MAHSSFWKRSSLSLQICTNHRDHFSTKIPTIYDNCRGYLEGITELKFDPTCSNPSRLMRLPFSTNWKDKSSPIPCKVLDHNPGGDISSIWAGFDTLAQFNPQKERHHIKSKKEIIANLDLCKVLNNFGYDKPESIKETGPQVV